MKTAYRFCVCLFSAQRCLRGYNNPFAFDRFETQFLYNVKKGNYSPHKVYSLFSTIDLVEMRNEYLKWMNSINCKKPVMELNKWVFDEFEKVYEAK